MKSLSWTSILPCAFLGAALVSAQSFSTSTVSAAASSTSSGAAQTHTITVGKADHKMVPDVTLADVGDIIEFDFFPPNHSVVRAEYGYPCIPYEMTGRDKVGFFAGFHPVDAILDEPPKWSVKINDTNPIFFYCSAPGSCTKYGMVGAINPNASTSLVHQRELAKQSAYSLSPGENFPEEGGPLLSSSTTSSSTSTSSSSSSSTPTSTTAAASTPSATAAPSKKSGLGAGAIAGIAIGAAIVAIMAVAIFYLLGRQKSLKQVMRGGNQPPQGPDPQMRSSTFPTGPGNGYAPPPMGIHGDGVPPYTFIPNDQRTSHAPTAYSDAPAYSIPKPYPQQNVEEVYPGAKLNQGPQRWSNVTHPNAPGHDGYQSPPLPGSPYLDQTRMSNNASPLLSQGVPDQQQQQQQQQQQLDGQINPMRGQHQPGVHELATQAQRSMSPDEERGDVKFR